MATSKTAFGKDIEMTEDEINEFLAHSDNSDSEESDWDCLEEVDMKEFLQSSKKEEVTGASAKKGVNKKTVNTKSSTEKEEGNSRKLELAPRVSNGASSTALDTKKGKIRDVGIGALFDPQVEKENSTGCPRTDEDSDVEDGGKSYLSSAGMVVKKRLADAQLAVFDRTMDKEMRELELQEKMDLLKKTEEEEEQLKKIDEQAKQLKKMEEKRKKLIKSMASENTVATVSGGQTREEYFVPAPSKIRVIRPRISSELWSSRISGRPLYKLSELSWRRRRSDLAATEWVTVGVLVGKTGARRSRKDTIFSVWRLNDLERLEENVSLFLFGGVHEKLWKEVEGSVVALLKPRLMEGGPEGAKATKGGVKHNEEVSLTVDNPLQVMLLGHSLDMAVCQGVTKAGNKCTKITNKSLSRFCDFHIKKAYTKATVSRPGFSNISFPTFGTKVNRRNSTPGNPFNSRNQSFGTTGAVAKSTNLTLSKLCSRPELSDTAVNWGLVDADALKKVAPKTATATPAPGSVKKQLDKNEDAFASMLQKASAGSMNFVKHLVQSEVGAVAAKPQQGATKSKGSGSVAGGGTFNTFFKNLQAPVLGRGLSSESVIDLNAASNSRQSQRKQTAASLVARQAQINRERAIRFVQGKGGMTKLKEQEKAKKKEDLKRRLDEMETPASRIAVDEKSSKRSRSTDLTSAALLAELKRGSSHRDLVEAEERDSEMRHLERLEKREELENRLTTLQEEKVRIVYCKKCQYKALSAADLCRKEGHPLVRTEGLRRYFKCKDCKKRTTTLERYPTVACKQCGGSGFLKTGMMAERKGPKLDQECLQLRGEERKNLNSMY